MTLNAWASRHAVSPAALYELRQILVGPASDPVVTPGASEQAVQSQVRVAASARGWRVFRNNIGAGRLESGSYVRWGLANDSAALNASVKSGDLIGCAPVLVTPQHVGQVIGQFVSLECKRAGWCYTATEREVAQLKWIEIITALGGYARFTTGSL